MFGEGAQIRGEESRSCGVARCLRRGYTSDRPLMNRWKLGDALVSALRVNGTVNRRDDKWQLRLTRSAAVRRGGAGRSARGGGGSRTRGRTRDNASHYAWDVNKLLSRPAQRSPAAEWYLHCPPRGLIALLALLLHRLGVRTKKIERRIIFDSFSSKRRRKMLESFRDEVLLRWREKGTRRSRLSRIVWTSSLSFGSHVTGHHGPINQLGKPASIICYLTRNEFIRFLPATRIPCRSAGIPIATIHRRT